MSCLILRIVPISASLSKIFSVATTFMLDRVSHFFRLSCGWNMMVRFCFKAANLLTPKNWLKKALFKSYQPMMEFGCNFIN